ncbi:hypothetical protein M513_00810 [Trichuris suis]|uniref:Uncharacterized protein n=1 Tax=Trichuris suis TaxID=68888 RepID=A0A085MMY8_9BILA|nr:hypothetical protein M513_00810 [Trichuris suis]
MPGYTVIVKENLSCSPKVSHVLPQRPDCSVAQREENSQSTAPGFESRPRTGSSLRRRQDVFLSRNAQEFSTSLQQLLPLNGEQWPRAVMDNASDFRFEDCTFGSSPGRLTSAENFLS